MTRTPSITKEWKNDQTCARYGLEENDKFSYKRYLIPCTSQSCNNSDNCDTCGPRGRHVRRNLWNFAHDCVELEVKRRLTNWSWKHIKEHVNKVQSIHVTLCLCPKLNDNSLPLVQGVPVALQRKNLHRNPLKRAYGKCQKVRGRTGFVQHSNTGMFTLK